MRTFVLAAIALSLCGCGTICNFGAAALPQAEAGPERPAVYGGVILDVAMLSEFNRPIGQPSGNPKGLLFILGCVIVDTPLSFVGDTLTLPITLCVERARKNAEAASRGLDEPPSRSEVGPVTSGSLAERALEAQRRQWLLAGSERAESRSP